MCNSSKDYNIFVDIGIPVAITNLHDKNAGKYENLSLSHILLDTDLISFAEFAEEILSMYNKMDFHSDRIDFYIDEGTLSRWNLFFDNFSITLYRGGYELDKDFTSDYTYTEFSHRRNFWIDLYYSPDTYDSDKVFKDILRELNNFYHRDFEKYLKEKNND